MPAAPLQEKGLIPMEKKYIDQEQCRESIMQAIQKIEDKERLELIERFARKLAGREVA